MSNGEKMDFPKSIWEFLSVCSFKDEEKVYTNGSLLIPTFRVKQAIEHYYEDCVSREAVIKIFGEVHSMDYNTQAYITNIQNLPSVTPQPKSGEWRHYERTITCSECDTEFYDDIMEYCGDDVPRFCPHCGARMNGGSEDAE